MSDTTVKTIREQVREAIDKHLNEMLRKSHELNYETLYVDTDGNLWWSEEADSNSYQARNGHAIPSLAKVGTGSVPCNCDACQEGGDPAEYDWYDGDAYDYAREEMERALDEIEVGYFDDEDDE